MEHHSRHENATDHRAHRARVDHSSAIRSGSGCRACGCRKPGRGTLIRPSRATLAGASIVVSRRRPRSWRSLDAAAACRVAIRSCRGELYVSGRRNVTITRRFPRSNVVGSRTVDRVRPSHAASRPGTIAEIFGRHATTPRSLPTSVRSPHLEVASRHEPGALRISNVLERSPVERWSLSM